MEGNITEIASAAGTAAARLIPLLDWLKYCYEQVGSRSMEAFCYCTHKYLRYLKLDEILEFSLFVFFSRTFVDQYKVFNSPSPIEFKGFSPNY